MAKQYLYRISVLKKMDAHPLEKLAYFSGLDQMDCYEGKVYKSTTSDKAVWGDLILPDRMNDFDAFCELPEVYKVRNKKPEIIQNLRTILWRDTAVQEKKNDYQCARMFELLVPSFLTEESAIEAVQSFGKHLMKQGMLVDASLHNYNVIQEPMSLFEQLTAMTSPDKPADEPSQNTQDYKAFLMCTIRDYKNGEFVAKNRNWNTYESLRSWRQAWFHTLEQHIDFADVEPAAKTKWLGKLNNFKALDKAEDESPNKIFRGFKP